MQPRRQRPGLKAERADLPRDLDRLREVEVAHQGKRFILRTPTTGVAGKLFQAARIALPPNIREPASDAAPAQPRFASDPKSWC